MSIESSLMQRAGSKCELCSSSTQLSVYDVLPNAGPNPDTSLLVCASCIEQMQAAAPADRWYGLKESMWSEHPAVQVQVYRILKSLGSDPWALDLLSQLYLDEPTQKWADAGVQQESAGAAGVVRDSNGTVLQAGDTVTLIKDLVVKGANFTAKRGTTVKNIALTDDPTLIEGRVNGTRIVLVTAYLKKA